MTENIIARGSKVALDNGALPEVIPIYLKNLINQTGGEAGPIGRQFVAQPGLEQRFAGSVNDPLDEEEHRVPNAPGLVRKYPWRALWTLTNRCGAYCRFCTRGRIVGDPTQNSLTREQIDQTLNYIDDTQNLYEIIASGGDPLTIEREKLNYVLTRLGEMKAKGKLRFVRIGTRLPIHNPTMINDSHYEALSKIKKPYIMLHINHPEELTEKSVEVIERIQESCRAELMGQTVLLRGVNDDEKTLVNLFTRMAEIGVHPYYLFQNDPVPWAKHLTVPLLEGIDLWNKLRPQLTGIAATARYVIDVPQGYGKISLPEGGAWKVDYDAGFTDFQGVRHPILPTN